MYWRPVLGFICHQGYSESEAQDLTQDFFVMILQGKLLLSADPHRGHFRCLLLKSLKNFLINTGIKARRQKRGGNLEFIRLDDWVSGCSPAANDIELCAPEALFDVRWAATIAEEALRRLREECESKGCRQLYDVLSRYLDADRVDICYRLLSTQLGVSEKSLKRLLHQFRKRFRSLLREEVAKTTVNAEEIEDEIRYLCAALSSVTT
jgi:DNA-directed RNA polymerase specialized sigma24 family protein